MRPALHNRLFLIVLLSGLPALVTALFLLREKIDRPLWLWLTGAALTAFLVAGAFFLRWLLVYRLRTAMNLATALRQGDLSFRARRSLRDGAYGSMICELNALADALREQRLDDMEAVALLRNVLGEIDVAVFAFDADDRLRMLNGAAERLLGMTSDAALGLEASALGLDETLDGDPERILSLDLPGADGRWELRRGGYRHLGRPRRLVILANVSRALRAEELAAWKRLIRVMSHELNNSLAPIRSLAGSLGKLVDDQSQPEGWREDMQTGLRIIAARAEALNRFVGAYATLAKLPAPRPAEVEIEPLVRRVAELESRQPVDVKEGPAVAINADRDQLEQLLINVVKNGVDACLEGEGAIEIGWAVEEGRLVLTVRDEGPGLSDTANLFVPFYSTRPEGTGIGLVLCRQIAEAHGGSITLENRSDRSGCEARVVLPLEPSLEA